MTAALTRWILFDLDGTLWDHTASCRRAIQHVCERYGLAPMSFLAAFNKSNDMLWSELAAGRMDFATLRVRRFELVLGQMACGCSSNDAQAMSDYYLACYTEQASLMPGTNAALNTARAHARLAIVTNGGSVIQAAKVRHFAVPNDTFEFMLCADQVGCAKPSSEFFSLAADRMGNPAPRFVTIVGDSLRDDILPADNIGWQTVWVRGHQEIPANLPPKTRVIRDISEFSVAMAAEPMSARA